MANQPDQDKIEQRPDLQHREKNHKEPQQEKAANDRVSSENEEALPEGSDVPPHGLQKEKTRTDAAASESSKTGNRSGVPPSNIRREDDQV